VFDKLGEGWIMSADLRDVMQHLGERLSDIEVDDMLKEADRDNNGRVFYQGIQAIVVYTYMSTNVFSTCYIDL
jgi:Ca2+-binding EF-hand superfamily protein